MASHERDGDHGENPVSTEPRSHGGRTKEDLGCTVTESLVAGSVIRSVRPPSLRGSVLMGFSAPSANLLASDAVASAQRRRGVSTIRE
jgi:hypothetical protein